jgi:hypothetical protein
MKKHTMFQIECHIQMIANLNDNEEMKQVYNYTWSGKTVIKGVK